MAMNYENRALLLLQPLLQLPQLSSAPSDRGAPGQPQMSQTRVCVQASLENPAFPFRLWALLQGLKRVTQPPHPKSTLSLCTYFSQCLRCGQP